MSDICDRDEPPDRDDEWIISHIRKLDRDDEWIISHIRKLENAVDDILFALKAGAYRTMQGLPPELNRTSAQRDRGIPE
jgi:hypothetical protein